MEGKIEYFEMMGDLWFRYKETVSRPTQHHSAVYREYKVEGKIPKKLQDSNDSKLIREYVEGKIRRKVSKAKKEDMEQDRYAENPSFQISVEYDGTMLKGKIISATDSFLRIRLELPKEFTGDSGVNYGFGAAMAGKYIFSGHKQFSTDAIASARRLLIDVYKKRKHEIANAEVISLAKSLNQG